MSLFHRLGKLVGERKQEQDDFSESSPAKGKGKSKAKLRVKGGKTIGGIRVLHDPNIPNVDIVFIHGLNGGQMSTWTARETDSDAEEEENEVDDGGETGAGSEDEDENKENTNRRNCPWPQSLLADDLPTARISSFGYDASVAKWVDQASQNRIGDHAINLVHDLASLRSKTKTTQIPIIFVAHSLGGLVCKNALSIASVGENYQQEIFYSTHAIAFLGTPHRGVGIASAISKIGAIVSKAKRTNVDIVRVLEPTSELLENVSNNFHRRLTNAAEGRKKVQITCFIEELPVKRYGMTVMVVPRESGILNEYNHLTIPADHIGMTKFENKQNAGYQRLLAQLERWVNMIDIDQEVNDPQDRDCLATLFVTDPTIDQAETEMQKGMLQNSACSWILEDPTYLAWLNSHASRQILWIHGDPGKGKTMIALALIKKLSIMTREAGSSKPLLAYFLYNNLDNRRNNVLAMAKSLLYQILRQQPYLLSHLRKDFSIQKGRLFSSLFGVWNLLENILSKISAKEIYLVIDALDECESGGLEAWLPILTQENTSREISSKDVPKSQHCRVKFVLTSRSNSEMNVYVTARRLPPNWLEINLEQRSSSIARGVEKFVSSKVAELANWKRYSEELKVQVEETLRQKAEGTFLWVALACQQLKKPHVKSFNTLKFLDSLPSGLPEIYRRILQEVLSNPDKEMVAYVKEMLRSVTVALRPLTLDELAIAAEIPLAIQDDPEILTEFARQCGSLITIRASKIYLVHQSAKDFLVSAGENGSICSEGLQEEHSNMTMRCLRYICTPAIMSILQQMSQQLSIDQEEDPIEDVVRSVAYLEYPVIHWITHGGETSLTAKTSRYVQESLNLEDYEKFFGPHSMLRKCWLDVVWSRRHSFTEQQPSSETFTSLHLAAYAGLSWLTETILQANDQESLAPFSLPPTSLPITTNIDGTDSIGRTPLHWAAKGGYVNVVQSLLGNRANVTSKDNDGKNALEHAAEGGHTAVMRQLLQHFAYIKSQKSQNQKEKYSSALQLACIQGQEEAVRMLLNEGANANYYDYIKPNQTRSLNPLLSDFINKHSDRGAPLIAASENGNAKIVSMLLECGADVNAKGGPSGNALQAASKRGFKSIVTMLLKSGADMQAPGGYYGYALQAASYNGHEHIVRILLREGANVNAHGGTFYNALQAAAFMGHATIVHMLLENGALVNATVEQRLDNAAAIQPNNALQAASTTGDEETVRTLLDHGAQVDNYAISAASKTGSPQLVALLLRAAKEKPLATDLDTSEKAGEGENQTQRGTRQQDQHEDQGEEAEVAAVLEQGAQERALEWDRFNEGMEIFKSMLSNRNWITESE